MFWYVNSMQLMCRKFHGSWLEFIPSASLMCSFFLSFHPSKHTHTHTHKQHAHTHTHTHTHTHRTHARTHTHTHTHTQGYKGLLSGDKLDNMWCNIVLHTLYTVTYASPIESVSHTG